MRDLQELNAAFWNERWTTGSTGWDIGYPAPAIAEFMLHHADRNASVLIPGCGNAYEAEFLVQNGFTDITLVDIAPAAVERLKKKFLGYPQVKVICQNYFDHIGQYDIQIEQTFFCALNLPLREKYAEKAASLLKEGGKIIGVLFNVDFGEFGPPFGGDSQEYREIFSSDFDIIKMEECYNSISPRAGNELFIQLKKKKQ